MAENIVVTTGIYDIIKYHLRRKKATKEQEVILIEQLRGAKQVLRRDLPNDVVTVNRKVKIKDIESDLVEEYIFVSTNKAKPAKNKHSILSEMALATVGYGVNTIIEWPFAEGTKKIQIVEVQPFEV